MQRALLLAGLLAVGQLQAATIVEVVATSPNQQWGAYGGACSPACERGWAMGWSQSDAFTDVTVQADLEYLTEAFDQSSPGTGHAYLMRQIGPGSTPADMVAFATFPGLPGTVSSLGMTTLFTGLTLAPGSYFLVLGSDGDSTGLWEIDFDPVVTLALGVGSLARYYLNGDSSPLNPAFLPAEDVQSPGSGMMPFRVTGETRNQVPVPGSMLLVGGGLLALALGRGRKAAGPA